MLHLRSNSPDATRDIAAAVARLARSGDVVVLAGEMGAGKTAFAQGFGAALGIDEPITSPTFNLVHSYPAGRITLHHADVYRLATHNEVADLALGELAEDRGIVLVEWGDVVAGVLGDHLAVRLDTVAAASEIAVDADPDAEGGIDCDVIVDEPRDITITGVGRSWATRWAALEQALGGVASC